MLQRSRIFILFLQAGISIPDLQSSYPERKKKLATFGKYIFVDTDCQLGTEEHVLYVIRGICEVDKEGKYYKNYHQVGRVNYKDGVIAFKFIEFRKLKSKLTQ